MKLRTLISPSAWTALAALAFVFVASTAIAEGPIRQRKENQQDRIAQGVGSGALTAGETARLERRESGLNREERGMRAADGGSLTPRDRRVLNGQQNRLSRGIYRQKHDAQHS
jgi:hypothetical protein